jgi:TetR/AcrR family transcriptional repressor of nem operon
MPWEKQFDENKVLDKAMHAFWRHGYKGTSMKCLVQETGLNPGSIYAAFDDKRSLFGRCLDRFEAAGEAARADLAATRPPREAILGLFDLMADQIHADDDQQGCLLVNSALEAGQDPDVAAVVKRAVTATEVFIQDRIIAGQAAGDIAQDRDAGETARLILALILGVRVLARTWPDHPFVSESKVQVARLLT